MRVDWGTLLTIFLAIVLASLVEHRFLRKVSPTAAVNPSAVYTNPLDKFVASHYPDATTI